MWPNEGVEKPNSELHVQDLESYFCRRRLSCHGTVSFFDRCRLFNSPHSKVLCNVVRVVSTCSTQRPLRLLHCIPMMRQLFDVVHQAIQFPLPVHFASSAQRKSVQLFVAPQVSEHRLHSGEAPRDRVSTHVRIDLRLHPLDVQVRNPPTFEKRHLADFGFMRCT